MSRSLRQHLLLSLRTKQQQYKESFTTHGLKTICRTEKAERLFWGVTLSLACTISFAQILCMIKKYQRRDIYTQISLNITERNYFPSLTICEKNLLRDSYFKYCGIPHRALVKNRRKLAMQCTPNQRINISRYSRRFNVEMKSFVINSCKATRVKDCNTADYWRPREDLGHSCLTWNYRGDYYDHNNEIDISFTFIDDQRASYPPSTFIFLHDSDMTDIEPTNKIHIDRRKRYIFTFEKTVIIRLPKPFKSHCSKNPKSVLPGTYSRYICMETQQYMELLKRCGDTFDYAKNLILPNFLHKYKKNITIEEFIKCAHWRHRGDISYHCPHPCQETELDIVSSVEQDGGPDFNGYSITIRHKTTDAYKVIEEKELYSFYQMVCDIGGFVALIMGSSFMSVSEIIIYGIITFLLNLLSLKP